MLKGLGSWHRNRVSDTAPAGIWFFCRKKGGAEIPEIQDKFFPAAGELFERFFSYIWRVSGIKLQVQPEIAEL